MGEDGRFVIRDYGPQDRDALNACIRELQEHERGLEPRMKTFEAIADSYQDGLLAHCEQTAGRIFVAEAGGAVVGYACVYAREPSTDEDEVDYEYALVADLAVNESHRGQGIGKALIAASERYARDAGAQWLRIWVLARNANAVELYRRSGFTPRTIELEKTLSAPGGQA